MSYSDPKKHSVEVPDSPADHEPDTVGTPEGDGETPLDAPPEPAPDGLQVPPTSDTNNL